ncbi:MFS transporter [Cerasicoccus frondis]|uniref:MFS transporter n=1 Tax=Cerasicoccus frondis TaxID=490090 RepID=UPI002852BAC0|nr:MFS transporter [Cerasicoccus frondis]
MLTRFCLYGFFKNQQYFEPFFYLALLAQGLDFFQIGILFGAKALLVNLFEIPTGAIADSMGRRNSLIFSHVAYCVSFILFAVAGSLPFYLVGMLFYAIGEAFRSGTHKSVIFSWLKEQGREQEKTQVYGVTRSWSKLGSALCAVVAAIIVFITEAYVWLFWLSCLPILLNIYNFLGYPNDQPKRSENAIGQKYAQVYQTLRTGLLNCARSRRLRGLLMEGMLFEGAYKSTKDYVQPLILQAALGLALLSALNDIQRVAVYIGVVYAIIFLISSLASRCSGLVLERLGGESRASNFLWGLDLLAYLFIGVGVLTGYFNVGIAGFLILTVLQNIWRPILVSRIADGQDEQVLATILSTESQTRSLFVAITAPALGYVIDLLENQNIALLPIAVLGIIVCLWGLLLARGSDVKPESLA